MTILAASKGVFLVGGPYNHTRDLLLLAFVLPSRIATFVEAFGDTGFFFLSVWPFQHPITTPSPKVKRAHRRRLRETHIVSIAMQWVLHSDIWRSDCADVQLFWLTTGISSRCFSFKTQSPCFLLRAFGLQDFRVKYSVLSTQWSHHRTPAFFKLGLMTPHKLHERHGRLRATLASVPFSPCSLSIKDRLWNQIAARFRASVTSCASSVFLRRALAHLWRCQQFCCSSDSLNYTRPPDLLLWLSTSKEWRMPISHQVTDSDKGRLTSSYDRNIDADVKIGDKFMDRRSRPLYLRRPGGNPNIGKNDTKGKNDKIGTDGSPETDE